jgi:hypothetical protein
MQVYTDVLSKMGIDSTIDTTIYRSVISMALSHSCRHALHIEDSQLENTRSIPPINLIQPEKESPDTTFVLACNWFALTVLQALHPEEDAARQRVVERLCREHLDLRARAVMRMCLGNMRIAVRTYHARNR